MMVPLATSPGRSGFGPQLSLTYDSGAGNGPFGFGWGLSLPTISRKTDRGLPQYRDADESDVFILSGAEDLVPEFSRDGDEVFIRDPMGRPVIFQEERDGHLIRRYRPRIEGLFARIERWTNQETGDIHWRSISRDNITTVYGKDNNSRIFDPADPWPDHPSRIFSWLICQNYDDKGNAIVYEYTAENDQKIDRTLTNECNRVRTANRYLKRIKYGNKTSRLIHPDLAATEWLFEMLFDYDEAHYEALTPNPALPEPAQHQLVLVATKPGQPWSVRPDPFSSNRAGFEVRTYRRCRRMLMFHNFEELGREPYLVRSTEFEYDDLDYSRPFTIEAELTHQGSTRFASFIRAVTQSGFVRHDSRAVVERDGIRYVTYFKKSLPPLEFEYGKAAIQDEIQEMDEGSLENLPAGLDAATYQWMDLNGEGVSGMLTEQAGTWFYKPNLGAGRFGPLEVVASKPSLAELSSGRHQLIDLAGDGQLDLVVFAGPSPGFYERTQDEGWEQFKTFRHLPNIRWDEPNLRFVDLNGDGHADVLITENEVFTWYPSLAEEGFDSPRYLRKPLEDEQGPRLVLADGTQSIYLADMCGDGLTDLVRIRNSEVCYWPNQGYGRFGAKVTMDNAPHFDYPDQFNQSRIRVADIDGSGTSDIVYLGRDGVRLYFNQSGNRWSEPRTLGQFPRVDNLSSVMTADLLGNGTACLVWSSPLPGDTPRQVRYINLMGGQKPHLLIKTSNNLGAETIVSYAPSTRFYFQDKLAGEPWVTRLPFPVHVVERVEIHDRISRNRFVTRYAYHHGYFDGTEREFRGFGMVEQLDTEEFATLSASDTFPDATKIDATSHVPPVLTKTWFHTGAYVAGGRISRHFEHEYYHEGDPSLGEGARSNEEIEPMLLPDTILPAGLTAAEEREACRSLKGAILRQEIYALDQKEESDRPYSVSERNYTIAQLQLRRDNRHAVLLTHARETIDFHYERKLYDIADQKRADPRVTHNVVLEADKYGNVLKAVAIGYGRRFDDPDTILSATDREQPRKTLLTLTENRYTNAVRKRGAYRTPMLAESRTYELIRVAPDAHQPDLTNLFGFQELKDKVAAASDGEHDLFYEDIVAIAATADHPYRRLVEHVRTLYRRDNLTAPLPLGKLRSRALPFESYKLAFTPGLLRQVFAGRVTDSMLESEGRYVHSEGDDNWWLPSGRIFFSRDPADAAPAELLEARAHFFLPRRLQDQFGNNTVIDYDDHDLLLTRTEDAVQNIVFAENNYRVLAPFRMTDPNGNRSDVRFDALGMVVGTAVMGKTAGPVEGDSFDTFTADLTAQQIKNYFDAANPHPLAIHHLGTATTRIIYDLDRVPASAASVARETHLSNLEPGEQIKVQLSFSYSDGFGREIQKKIQAEPGKVPRRDPTTGRIVLVDGQPAMTENDANPRWVGSGWTVFNNKGKPVRQYEPFFTDTHRFEFDLRIGVSPVFFYDPVERVVATLRPNHVWEKTVFDPWQQRTYDVNDNVLAADPRTDPDAGDFFRRLPDAEYLPAWHAQRQSGALGPHEQAAARKAAIHANTPTVAYFDTLGRTFLTVAHNRSQRSDSADPPTEEFHHTRVTFDIEGNQREVIDAKDRVVMRYDYDMLGARIHQASMEAGERWTLNNVAGKPIRGWDSRGHTARHEYDALQRPTHLFVRVGSVDEKLVERLVYGELQLEALALNLRGKLYQHYDGAGVLTAEANDFKGNALSSSRRLAREYKQVVDWSALSNLTEINSITTAAAPMLESETFSGATSYDALNRPVTLTMPDRSVIRPEYNEANLLNAVRATLRGAGDEKIFVRNIDYDAKGQRVLIDYGNRVRTTYEYDPLTFRLVHLLTLRDAVVFPGDCPQPSPTDWPGCQIQNLHYTYDPAGNITNIRDDAQQTIFFQNQRVEPSTDYTYDATFRLIEATGREHLGQTGGVRNAPTASDAWNFFHTGLPHPGDGNAMGNYIEEYNYDQLGNFINVIHRAIEPIHRTSTGSWQRSYDYQEDSLLEPGGAIKSNRLTSTTVGTNGSAGAESYRYDEHGNMTRMPHLVAMEWDDKDQLHVTQRQVRDDGGAGERTYYAYDSSGQRTRKVTENSANPGVTPTRKEERIYLGGFEIYRSYNGTAANVQLERETLHIMDDQQRIALVETKTKDADQPPIPNPQPLIRYQFSNHLGSASLELDDAGAVISYEEYFPYGSTSYQAVNAAIKVSQKRYRYIGKERDGETGFHYYGARYYAVWLGRWLTVDPLEFEDGLNLFMFARNNPTRYYDPDGQSVELGYDTPGQFTDTETRRRTTIRSGTAREQLGQIQIFLRAVGVAQANALGLTGETAERFVEAESEAIGMEGSNGHYRLTINAMAAQQGRGGRDVSWVLQRLIELTQVAAINRVVSARTVTGAGALTGATYPLRMEEGVARSLATVVGTSRGETRNWSRLEMGGTIVHELIVHAWREVNFPQPSEHVVRRTSQMVLARSATLSRHVHLEHAGMQVLSRDLHGVADDEAHLLQYYQTRYSPQIFRRLNEIPPAFQPAAYREMRHDVQGIERLGGVMGDNTVSLKRIFQPVTRALSHIIR
jgi:RHS repeat-associated protein